MSVSAETLRKLMAAGVTGDALVRVVELIDADIREAAPQLPVQSAGARRQAAYRARRDLQEGMWSLLRASVLLRDRHTCVYCGSTQDIQCDHVMPLCRGGTNDPDNLVASCKSCNTSKGGKTLGEWCGP